MTQTLTPGRWRGLRTTSSRKNVFNILAFDQRGNFRNMLPPDTSYEAAAQMKRDIVLALSYHATAVLLDSEFGLPALVDMNGGSGVLLAYEESGYSGDSTYRRIKFYDNWTIEKIKLTGASAAKVLAYYNPRSGELATEIEGVLKQVAEDCHKHDLPFFLEPLCYSLDPNVTKDSAEFAKLRPDLVIETAERLSKIGVDVLKMESPVDPNFDSNQQYWADTFAALSKASTVPWVLLSGGVNYETFETQIRLACESGASGWLGGRAIWKEAITMTPEQRSTFLSSKATERMQRLNAISAQYARPWSEFYTPPVNSVTWFADYNP